jgi:general transcription factor 3C polypeptide 3 (transcription factor C subunit 4)
MQARKLMTIYQFNNEPLRLIFTSLAGNIRNSADAFINTALQKHIFRELRIIDTAIKKPDALIWFSLRSRWILSKKGKAKGKGKKPDPDEDEEDEDEQEGEGDGASASAGPSIPLPTKHNPAFMTMYAQMCNVAKSYQSAICECPYRLCTTAAD